MAEKRPVVIYGEALEELRAGDTLPGVGSADHLVPWQPTANVTIPTGQRWAASQLIVDPGITVTVDGTLVMI